MVSVDEKPSAQASERVTGYGETNSAKIVRLHETPQRRVTLNRFAALQVTTGEIKTNKIIRKPREESLQPMDQMGGEAPRDGERHKILDHWGHHKKCDAWLAKNSNVPSARRGAGLAQA